MDKLSKEKRSWNMSKVKSKDTKPELTVRSSLHKMGFRFRIHVKHLPGNPDVVLPKYRAVIFIHGCFWHGHDDCADGKIPKTRAPFWKNKIYGNISRDKNTYTQLSLTGWRIAIIWGCALKNKRLSFGTIKGLVEWIRSDLDSIEVPVSNYCLETTL